MASEKSKRFFFKYRIQKYICGWVGGGLLKADWSGFSDVIDEKVI
jgi:hypothetical protein